MHASAIFIATFLFKLTVVVAMDDYEFRKMSMSVSLQSETFQLSSEIPSKELACALKCADYSTCVAHDFDQASSKCSVMTQIIEGTTDLGKTMFFRVKGYKTFKVATQPTVGLQLNCNELQKIPKIQNQTVCADLAQLDKSANAVSFDGTKEVCSIQECPQNVNIPVIGVPSANISIMFESAFYPTTCPGRLLISGFSGDIVACPSGHTLPGNMDFCTQKICDGSYDAANADGTYCNTKYCPNGATTVTFGGSYRILYRIPK